MRIHMPIPRFIRRAALKFVLVTQNHYDKRMERAAQLAEEDYAKSVRELQ
jgi:hypothetical protein